MANNMAKLRAALKSAEEKKQKAMSGFQGDNASYAFWNIQEGETAVFRFLPDGNPENDFFWVERQVMKFPFAGVINSDNDVDNEILVQVPCIEMYYPNSNKKDPVLDQVRSMWKKKENEEEARKYWVKRSFLFQGFVVKNPLDEGENAPKNPIRRFTINKSVFQIIENSLWEEDEFEDAPTDYDNGLDFKLKKTRQGSYSSYTSSEWSRKTRGLDDDERAAIEEHGLFTLNDFLPKEPNDDELKIIMDMFNASRNGDPYDYKLWGSAYTPSNYRLNRNEDGTSQVVVSKSTTDDDDVPAPASKKVSKPVKVVEEDSHDEYEDSSPSTSGAIETDVSDPDEVLKAIRAKMGKGKS